MTKIPAGYVLVRLDDLAALHAARADPSPPLAPPVLRPAEATLPGLAEAVALLTARASGLRIPLADDVPAASVAATLAILAAAFLGQLLPPDRAAALLADLGLAAAHERTS